MDDFEETFEGTCQAVHKDFLQDGYLVPVIYIHLQDLVLVENELRQAVIMVPTETGEQHKRNNFYRWLKQDFGGRTSYYIEAGEVWLTTGPANLDDTIGRLCPSLDPERKEVLLVHGSHKDGRNLVRLWELDRDPPRLSLMQGVGRYGSGLDSLLLGWPARNIGINPATDKFDWRPS